MPINHTIKVPKGFRFCKYDDTWKLFIVLGPDSFDTIAAWPDGERKVKPTQEEVDKIVATYPEVKL